MSYGIQFLGTVRIEHLTPAGARILAAIAHVAMLLKVTLTVTCGREAHGATNPHTLGRALDLRTKDLSVPMVLRVFSLLRDLLGPHFTVLYETPTKVRAGLEAIATPNARATGEHIHVQLKKGLIEIPADPPASVRA